MKKHQKQQLRAMAMELKLFQKITKNLFHTPSKLNVLQ
jgi:hypothetical protein